jgi:hypothetical protein
MNSLSDLITLSQVQSFQNAIANFAGEQESAIIDFAILLQMQRTGDSKENYVYAPYMFSGEFVKSISWLNEEQKTQFMYFFLVDYLHPETKKPYTICIKVFGFSSLNTQMQKAKKGDLLTVKFTGLKPNPKPKAKPFLSCYVSGFKTTPAATLPIEKPAIEQPAAEVFEKKNSNENTSDELPF